jgi:hypothetical protein
VSRPFSRGWAPVSSGSSTRLAFVGFLFYANAGLATIILVAALADIVFHFLGVQWSPIKATLSIGGSIMWIGINWWTAKELQAGRRRALSVGLPIFGLLLLQELLRWRGNSIKIAFSALCLLALLSVWNELEA